MKRQITSIPLIHAKRSLPVALPVSATEQINDNDPAERVMLDFTQVFPVTVEGFVDIDQARRKMQENGVRFLLVTDLDDRIAGVINAYRIMGEKPMQYAKEHGIGYQDITVERMMQPLNQVPAMDYSYVQQSLVRHVISTIQVLEYPYALVIETLPESGDQRIRGIFTSSYVSRLLRRSVFNPLHAVESLADIRQELEHAP